jgi:hypothetical protein
MVIVLGAAAFTAGHAESIIITHACTDTSAIPEEWIDAAQSDINLHYAHTSHGGQLTTGVSRIEAGDSKYSVAIGYSSLPTEPGALCIFDGQEHDTYITPDEYWETETGLNYTRDVLDNNPSINVSMWSWCTQLTYYSQVQCQAYIDAISMLESEYPAVRFVYMTCNAQATGSSGYNRYVNNEMIRQHCQDNDRILFDFADLDAWWYNPSGGWEFSSYEYSGADVLLEHPQFNGDQAGHTTYESCEQKGKAVWWLVARLAGWPGTGACIAGGRRQGAIIRAQPNPFSYTTTITFAESRNGAARVTIFDVAGRRVRDLGDSSADGGSRTAVWDGRDDTGRLVEAGVYFVSFGWERGAHEIEKLVVLR